MAVADLPRLAIAVGSACIFFQPNQVAALEQAPASPASDSWEGKHFLTTWASRPRQRVIEVLRPTRMSTFRQQQSFRLAVRQKSAREHACSILTPRRSWSTYGAKKPRRPARQANQWTVDVFGFGRKPGDPRPKWKQPPQRQDAAYKFCTYSDGPYGKRGRPTMWRPLGFGLLGNPCA